MPPTPLVLYDGYCSFCNSWVRFILRYEQGPHYHFMPLQSSEAAALLGPFQRDPQNLDSVYVLEDGQLWERSDAALRIVRHLRWPWRGLAPLVWVPRILRNVVYDAIGRYRYQLFGRSDYCAALSVEQQHRFHHTPPPQTGSG